VVRALALRTRLAKVTLALGALTLLSACGNSPQSAMDPQGPYAQQPHDLILVVFAIALGVFILVQGLIIYSVIKFRRRDDDDGSLPAQVHGNTRLEIAWTIVPALILAGIAVPTVQGIFDQSRDPGDEALVVEVIGHRWWWEFHYPEQDGIEAEILTANELVIPAGRTVRLQMTAADPGRSPDRGVLHSFWVPALGGKQDVIPGQTTVLNYEANEPGRYLGQCAEYCGLSHVNMRNRAVALTAEDFATWVDQQQAPADVPEDGSPEAEGRALFNELGPGADGEMRQACIECHAVFEGEGERQAIIGPDLTHLFSREEFAGAIEDLTPENLRAWLENPNEIKPMQYASNDIGMPDLDLSEDELDALVAYLVTLQ
jgi:cytochrome c oxidase subunit 2